MNQIAGVDDGREKIFEKQIELKNRVFGNLHSLKYVYFVQAVELVDNQDIQAIWGRED